MRADLLKRLDKLERDYGVDDAPPPTIFINVVRAARDEKGSNHPEQIEALGWRMTFAHLIHNNEKIIFRPTVGEDEEDNAVAMLAREMSRALTREPKRKGPAPGIVLQSVIDPSELEGAYIIEPCPADRELAEYAAAERTRITWAMIQSGEIDPPDDFD